MSEEEILKMVRSEAFKEWRKRRAKVELADWRWVKRLLTEADAKSALEYVDAKISILEKVSEGES